MYVIHEQSMNHISLKKGLVLCKITHCTERVSTNTRPHQLCWGDREMGTAISCIKYSQVAGLIQRVGRSSSEASSLCAAVMDKAWYVSLSAKEVSLLLYAAGHIHVLSVHGLNFELNTVWVLYMCS